MKKLLISSLLLYGHVHFAMQSDDIKKQKTLSESQQMAKKEKISWQIALAESFMLPSAYLEASDDKIIYTRMIGKNSRKYLIPTNAAILLITNLQKMNKYTHYFDIIKDLRELHKNHPAMPAPCLLELICDEQKLQIQAFRLEEFISETNSSNLKFYKKKMQEYEGTNQFKKYEIAHTALKNRKKFIIAVTGKKEDEINTAAQLPLYPEPEKFISLQEYILKALIFAIQEKNMEYYSAKAATPR